MKSIQSKILFVVIAGLLVITLVVSVIAVKTTHEIMHKDASRILKNAAQREAAYINNKLDDVVESCEIMKHCALSAIDDIEVFRDEQFLKAYLEKAETLFMEIAVNTPGVEGVYLSLDPSVVDGTTGFYSAMEGGRFQAQPVIDLSMYDADHPGDAKWYFDAAAAGEGIWLDPYCNSGCEDQVISYVIPLYVGEDLIGVVGCDINFPYLLNQVDNIALYTDGFAVLMARDRETQYSEVEMEDSDSPGAEATVPLANGMYLVVHARYKDIQQDVRPMLYRIILGFLIVLACAIVYTVFYTRKIVGPLKNLTIAAQNLAEGGTDVVFARISANSKDEVGTLSRVLADSYAKIKEYTAYINAVAYRDSLTGVKNNAAYAEVITELNEAISAGNHQFGILVADVNNLKQTNDRYGHDAGNKLIISIARILVDTFKNSRIFRIGGDEFVAILQGSDYEEHSALLEKLDAAYANECIPVGGKVLAVSAARGVALFDPSVDHAYEDVFAKADQAMYINKKTSKEKLSA